MKATKKEIISLIESLPESCTIEDIQYHLYVLGKIQNGIHRAELETHLSQKEVESKFRKWIV